MSFFSNSAAAQSFSGTCTPASAREPSPLPQNPVLSPPNVSATVDPQYVSPTPTTPTQQMSGDTTLAHLRDNYLKLGLVITEVQKEMEQRLQAELRWRTDLQETENLLGAQTQANNNLRSQVATLQEELATMGNRIKELEEKLSVIDSQHCQAQDDWNAKSADDMAIRTKLVNEVNKWKSIVTTFLMKSDDEIGPLLDSGISN